MKCPCGCGNEVPAESNRVLFSRACIPNYRRLFPVKAKPAVRRKQTCGKGRVSVFADVHGQKQYAPLKNRRIYG